MISVIAAVIIPEAKTPFLIISSRFLPKAMEMNVPVPSDRPIITDVRKVMSVYDEPTAASALSPMYLPTIHVSARL